jgi:FixJ family two-component response regulator/putative methionine-R-sulfoxide reductase with GAF domain
MGERLQKQIMHHVGLTGKQAFMIDTPSPIIYLIDDDIGIQRSVDWLIQPTGLTVHAFSCAADFLSVYQNNPGCLILDIHLRDLNGLEFIRELPSLNITIPVIATSGTADISMAVEAIKSGAIDFVSKPFNGAKLIDRIHVAVGSSVQQHKETSSAINTDKRASSLSPREREVMRLLVNGKSNKAIAQDLKIGIRTVETHRAEVMRKLGVKTAIELLKLTINNDASKYSTPKTGVESGHPLTSTVAYRRMRTMQTLSACSRVVFNATDEQSLLDEICSTIVEVGGYTHFWVGYAMNDAVKTVKPMAQVGFLPDAFGIDLVTWDESSLLGQGVFGNAIRSKKPSVVRDCLHAESHAIWFDISKLYKYNSLLGLPLFVDGKVIGAIGFYSPEVNGFDANEVALLEEVAAAIGYGISVIRMRAEREKLRFYPKATNPCFAENSFSSLTKDASTGPLKQPIQPRALVAIKPNADHDRCNKSKGRS